MLLGGVSVIALGAQASVADVLVLSLPTVEGSAQEDAVEPDPDEGGVHTHSGLQEGADGLDGVVGDSRPGCSK